MLDLNSQRSKHKGSGVVTPSPVIDGRKKGALKSPAFYSNFDQVSINVAACETICLAGNQSREEAVKEREIFSVSEIL